MKAHSILALALLAVGAPAPAQRVPDPPVKQGCAQLSFLSPEESASMKPRTSFSATRTIDLMIGVTLRQDLKQDQVLQLRILLPSGHLYQTLTVPVMAPGTSPTTVGKGVEVPGFRRPVPAFLAREDTSATGSPWRVDVPFPVGGTQIVSNSLYGAWSVLVHRGDEPLPCAPAATFTIVP